MDGELISEKLKSFREGWEACAAFMAIPPERKLSSNFPRIEKVFIERYGTTFKDLAGKTRKKEWVFARQLAQTFLRRYTPLSYKSIGELFNRDHTTIIHSIETLRDLVGQEPYSYEMEYIESCVSTAVFYDDYSLIVKKELPPVTIGKPSATKYIILKKRKPIENRQEEIEIKKIIRPEAEYSNIGHINLTKKYGN